MSRPSESVSPILIGPRNCEHATGLPWRHVRDHARQLGVEPVRVGRKLAIPADAFLAALANERGGLEPRETCDPAAALREQLGLRLVAGGRE